MSHSHWIAVVVLAVVIFLFDSLWEKRSMSPPKSQVLNVFKILTAHWGQIAELGQCHIPELKETSGWAYF